MTISVSESILLQEERSFKIRDIHIRDYRGKNPNFGFNGLGEFIYMRSYSRINKEGEKETWFDTIRRVVEGTYSIQKAHIQQNGLRWKELKAQKSATKMFKYMFDMKFLPAGRGLWAMGTDIITKKGLFGALNNCAFVSTKDIGEDFVKPFAFMTDMSMQGAGVGFDVKGAGKRIIHKPYEDSNLTPPAQQTASYIIPDTREGWVEAISSLLRSYALPLQKKVLFDYTSIREEGIPLKTFGGFSSGYEPLETAIERIRVILDALHQQSITETAIADIMNIIGDCVVAGGIRRTAQISFGKSEEFLNLKNFERNKYRSAWMNRSNNSIEAEVGQNYEQYVDHIINNGEPGFFWKGNAQHFGRMGRNQDELWAVDMRAEGGNPCLEQTLESYEMCCLVETFPNRMKDCHEFFDVLKYAYLYAKTVTLGRTSWAETNEVMLRNRRIGTSVSGIAQFVAKHGIAELRGWLKGGYESLREYDVIYSEWLAVPRSIKITSVKPSGTISLLAGATAGIHYPISESRFYIRHVEVSNSDPLYKFAIDKGYEVEPKLIRQEDNTWLPSDTGSVIKFYIDAGTEPIIPSMWHQLEMTAFMQEHWADNQVSVTVKFDPETEGKELARALDFYQYRLKGVSFLPRRDLNGEYKQIPYQAISEEEYKLHDKDLIAPSSSDIEWKQPEADVGCTTDYCEIKP